MSSSRAYPDRDRLSVLTAVILLAYALTRFIEFPSRSVGVSLFGSPLAIQLNGRLLLLLLVAALVSTGSDALFRGHPFLRERPGTVTAVHWILPGLSALLLGGMLNRAPEGLVWWVGLATSALVLMAVLVAEYFVLDPNDARHDAAKLGLVALSYALAIAVFGLLRATGLRAALSATTAGLAAALIGLRLFLLHGLSLADTWKMALALGLSLAEMSWAGNYTRFSPVGTGLILVVPLYLGVGLTHEHLSSGIRTRTLVEYGLVVLMYLAVAAWLSP